MKAIVEKYNEIYHDYDAFSEKLVEFIKAAKKKLKAVKKSEEQRQENLKGVLREEEEKRKIEAVDGECKERCKVEEHLLNLKISQYENLVDINDGLHICAIDEYVTKMEGFINEYFDLSKNLKFYFGKEYDETYEPRFVDKTKEINENIKMAKILRRKHLDVAKEKETEKSAKTKQEIELLGAQNLSSEINLRCEFLETEFDQELKNLSDYEILEISQNKNIDSELNGVLEKVTALASLASKGSEAVQNLLDLTICKRDHVISKRKLFKTNLQSILNERDITPDKLKNASTLKIQIPKFSGYDCVMDFYTFKTEFQKLVEPTVQKKYWADYLKRNYLTGSALTLVEKENEYLKIWERLLESYGNARLLLQNKLRDLEKIGGLWKIKGEEKIANALASLVNNMRDLSSLASEHKIEGELYEGGGLEKVMGLIGYSRHRKFRSKNLDVMRKKVEWEKLLEFLKQELHLRERMVLDSKTAKLMGLESERQKDRRDTNPPNWPKGANYGIANDLKCPFCGKSGHTVVTTAKGNKIIPYYVCETFVNMSPKDRFSQLKGKGLCTKCLFPGAIVGPKHKCLYFNYCCPHSSHVSTEKLHVLLCETHKNDGENVKYWQNLRKDL